MKRPVALLVLAALAPMLQGALMPFLPNGWFPDLSLLLMLTLALVWRSTAGGLLVTAFCGFVADLLSGSLLGQHALVGVSAYLAARVASGHINLMGARAQVVFAALLTVGSTLMMGGLTAFFSPGTGLGFVPMGELGAHAVANGIVAPPFVAACGALVARLGDEDSGRRLLRLEPRRFSA